MRIFQDDDAGYLARIDGHQHGFVVNTFRKPDPRSGRGATQPADRPAQHLGAHEGSTDRGQGAALGGDGAALVRGEAGGGVRDGGATELVGATPATCSASPGGPAVDNRVFRRGLSARKPDRHCFAPRCIQRFLTRWSRWDTSGLTLAGDAFRDVPHAVSRRCGQGHGRVR